MQCSRCGALLRANARFCNNCGLIQPQTPQRGTDALSTDTAEQMGRIKRPSRPLRPDAPSGFGVAAPSTAPHRAPPGGSTVLLD